MSKKRNNKFKITILILVFLLLMILFCFCFLNIREVIINYAESQATSIVFNIANDEIEKEMARQGVTYNDIVKLSKNSENNISALEIDAVKINQMKSRISSQISKEIGKYEEYNISVPIGTLTGNEYLLGFGPKIKFRMKITSSVFTGFESNFYSAGINQVLHQVVIKVKIKGNLVLPWNTKGFETNTDVIAAQTVLVGVVPDAFTNVIEADGGEIASEIFDYGAELN